MPRRDHERRYSQQNLTNACVCMIPLYSAFLHPHQPTIQLHIHLSATCLLPTWSVYAPTQPSILPSSFRLSIHGLAMLYFAHLSFIHLSTQPFICPSLCAPSSHPAMFSVCTFIYVLRNHSTASPLACLSTQPAYGLQGRSPWSCGISPPYHTLTVTSPWFWMGDTKSSR